MSGNTSGEDDQWAWLDTPPDPDQLSEVTDPGVDIDLVAEPTVPQENWDEVVPTDPGPDASEPRAAWGRFARRVPVRGVAGLAAVLAVVVWVVVGAHAPHHPSGGGTGTKTASMSASATAGVCAGLSGTVVTEHGGDPATVPGVIATFEDAYYTQRNAEAAMRVVAPESGITQQALAAGIATIPAGTRHCVAITPVTLNTANVHLVEVHPDHKRVDYLQVINTISGPSGGLLISHVQEQG
ncbi:hypothetical protein [Nocardia vaccinii]|uniref:hypothetical protein n=1 Tax=Nocardia vaccinii TaxID=1822 RepID=UPI0008338D76|nr:hypothetical protein [Nocardia vaccinii]